MKKCVGKAISDENIIAKKKKKKRNEGGKCVFYDTHPFRTHVLARQISLGVKQTSASKLNRFNTKNKSTGFGPPYAW